MESRELHGRYLGGAFRAWGEGVGRAPSDSHTVSLSSKSQRLALGGLEGAPAHSVRCYDSSLGGYVSVDVVHISSVI